MTPLDPSAHEYVSRQNDPARRLAASLRLIAEMRRKHDAVFALDGDECGCEWCEHVRDAGFDL